MAYKINDFKCKECGVVHEDVLYQKDNENEIFCQEEQCNCTEPMEKLVTVNKNKTAHISWSKWRA